MNLLKGNAMFRIVSDNPMALVRLGIGLTACYRYAKELAEGAVEDGVVRTAEVWRAGGGKVPDGYSCRCYNCR